VIWLLPWKSDAELRHLPLVTWALMAVNIAVFMLSPREDALQFAAFVREYGLVPGDWHAFQYLTSVFMHADWPHLLGNMFFLWLFGDKIEDALGPAGFLLIYALGGFAGNLLYVSANEHMIPSIGASGCLAAIAGAYAVLFFARQIDLKLMLVVIPVYTLKLRAFWVLGLYFGVDTLLTLKGRGALDGGGVNYVAHGAGFLSGVGLGLVASMYGVMGRYDALNNGSGWWGYLPASLEEEARRQRLRELQRRRPAPPPRETV
jgi:membrane associated rhomboid family serine protease